MSKPIPLNIAGMSCAACVASVERVAQAVEGVAELAVNLPLHRGRLSLNQKASSDTIENVIKAIEGAGFVASVREEQQDSAAGAGSVDVLIPGQ